MFKNHFLTALPCFSNNSKTIFPLSFRAYRKKIVSYDNLSYYPCILLISNYLHVSRVKLSSDYVSY